MARPRNSLNVTEAERERIRELYRQGLRLTEICRRTGRSDSVVSRTVRGMKRPRPRPRSRVARRNELIAQRVLDEGVPQAVMARRCKLTPTSICLIVKKARAERAVRGAREAERAASTAGGGTRPERPSAVPRTRPSLTRDQRGARDREIRRLVNEEQVAIAIVARRYDLSPATVRRIASHSNW